MDGAVHFMVPWNVRPAAVHRHQLTPAAATITGDVPAAIVVLRGLRRAKQGAMNAAKGWGMSGGVPAADTR